MQGGLAGAVGPDQPDPLAGAELERHPVEDRLGAVVLLDAFNLKKDHRDVWFDVENRKKTSHAGKDLIDVTRCMDHSHDINTILNRPIEDYATLESADCPHSNSDGTRI